jgi:hypothetical protein
METPSEHAISPFIDEVNTEDLSQNQDYTALSMSSKVLVKRGDKKDKKSSLVSSKESSPHQLRSTIYINKGNGE